MENSIKSVMVVTLVPALLILALSTNVIKSAEASRSPAVEKTHKPLKAHVLNYLVQNAR